jgi:hypothetical protein
MLVESSARRADFATRLLGDAQRGRVGDHAPRTLQTPTCRDREADLAPDEPPRIDQTPPR